MTFQERSKQFIEEFQALQDKYGVSIKPVIQADIEIRDLQTNDNDIAVIEEANADTTKE